MVIRIFYKTFFTICLTLASLSLFAQEKEKIIDFMTPDEYIIGGVTVSGGEVS